LVIGGLLKVGQVVDIGPDADSTQCSLVMSVSLLGYVSNRIQHLQFDLLEVNRTGFTGDQ
jgi:hypothetical protein